MNLQTKPTDYQKIFVNLLKSREGIILIKFNDNFVSIITAFSGKMAVHLTLRQ